MIACGGQRWPAARPCAARSTAADSAATARSPPPAPAGQSTLAGVGLPASPRRLHTDLHSYLRGEVGRGAGASVLAGCWLGWARPLALRPAQPPAGCGMHPRPPCPPLPQPAAWTASKLTCRAWWHTRVGGVAMMAPGALLCVRGRRWLAELQRGTGLLPPRSLSPCLLSSSSPAPFARRLPGTATEQGGPALAASYHASLEDSAAAHFPGNSVVNCMCGSTGERSGAAGARQAAGVRRRWRGARQVGDLPEPCTAPCREPVSHAGHRPGPHLRRLLREGAREGRAAGHGMRAAPSPAQGACGPGPAMLPCQPTRRHTLPDPSALAAPRRPSARSRATPPPSPPTSPPAPTTRCWRGSWSSATGWVVGRADGWVGAHPGLVRTCCRRVRTPSCARERKPRIGRAVGCPDDARPACWPSNAPRSLHPSHRTCSTPTTRPRSCTPPRAPSAVRRAARARPPPGVPTHATACPLSARSSSPAQHVPPPALPRIHGRRARLLLGQAGPPRLRPAAPPGAA